MNIESPDSKFPLGMKIAVVYLMFVGITGLLWPVFDFGPHHVEFAQKSATYKLGVHSREVIFSALFLTSGIGLIRRRAWARKLALILIPIATIYGTNDFAWGLMHGKPTVRGYTIAFVFVVSWNAIWFWLILRKSTKNALLSQ